MKSFLKKIVIFLILFTIVVIGALKVSSVIVYKRGFLNYQTESNLLVFQNNTHYDLLLMGISHARNFSRHKNHLRVEKILGQKIINIGQGGGACGVNEQLFYLDYFYFRNNKSKRVVYILSPPLFFSESLPIASNTFDFETFEFNFLTRYLTFPSENKAERILSYLQNKNSKEWLNYYPNSLERKAGELSKIDSTAIEEGQDLAYQNSSESNMIRFRKSALRIEETIKLARKHHSEVILIIPPTLFGKWRGHEKVVRFGLKMANKSGVQFYDLSESVLIPNYYYDHHHLNTKGIEYFTEKFLRPIFSNKKN